MRLTYPRPSAEDERVGRYRAEVRRGELTDTIAMAKWSAIGHAAAAAHIVMIWEGEPALLLSMFGAAITAIIGCAFLGVWRYRRSDRGERAVDRARRMAAWLAGALGLTWGAAAIGLSDGISDDHRLVLVVIIAGLVPEAFVIGPIARVACAITLPLAAGALIALARDTNPMAPDLMVLLVIYTTLILLGSRLRGRHTSERILDRLRVADQKDTIALLLHDFEEGAADWLWETNAGGRLVHVSAGLAQALGVPVEAVAGTRFEEWIALDTLAARPNADEPELRRCFEDRQAFRNLLVSGRRGGERRWWRLSGKLKTSRSGLFLGFRGVGADVTEAKVAEEQVAYLANYDALTGAANRNLFQERLQAELGRVARDGCQFSLLVMNLDEFKLVNDTFGHGAGDAVLTALADRLRQVAGDTAYVARLGGDEFAVIAPDLGSGEALGFARRLMEAAGHPVIYQDARLAIGLSIGLVTAPADGADAETLVKRADLALQEAKAGGGGRAEIFRIALESDMQGRRLLETDLRHALDRGDLVLTYQPIIGSASGRVTCCEALLRWNRPGFGPVPPTAFIPAAETTGEILRIGAWVLRTACLEAATWPDHIRVAVNLSMVQARSADLLDVVHAALDAGGLAPNRLELEITESVFLEMTLVTARNFEGLRRMGVRIALDDFGTGYSSLSYLLKLSVDKIKIDRTFIQASTQRREGRAVVDSILNLARTLGMTVTAEGIETEAQAAYLRAQGCDEMQGFLFGHPVTAQALGARMGAERNAAFDTGARASGPMAAVA
jgi:diguanylate cyclase (GGDEF)-like protein